MFKKILLASMLAASVVSIAVPASAAIFARVAPPAPRDELVPAPRSGYMWAPGYWNWNHNRHVWVKGSWMRERRGYHYTQPAWEERDGRWHMNRGAWARGDRDHDGVPDRLDRHPDNPRRN
jgi:WXXGXW repeat (2 copies)